MNKFLTVGCVAAVLTATPIAAQAADAARPIYRTPAGVVYDWTGFYVGAHVGGGWTGGDNGQSGGYGQGWTPGDGQPGSR